MAGGVFTLVIPHRWGLCNGLTFDKATEADDRLSVMDRLLTMREVEQAVGLSRSAIYDRIAAGRFPQPVKIGAKSSRWVSSDIQSWIDSLPRRGDGTAAQAGEDAPRPTTGAPDDVGTAAAP